MKIETIRASHRNLGTKVLPYECNHRIRGGAGFSLTELLVVLSVIFIVFTFLGSLSIKAVVAIGIGAFMIRLGWFMLNQSVFDGSFLQVLVKLPFSLAVMAFGVWLIFIGLTGK